MSKIKAFFVYPSQPEQLNDIIKLSITEVNNSGRNIDLKGWAQLDIPGHFIVDNILENIDVSELIIADITKLNFNVMFEIGYAIGKKKRVILVLNPALSPEMKNILELGILDTIGYEKYENSNALSSLINRKSDITPLKFIQDGINKKAPIFLLNTLHKTDYSLRISSKIKKARIHYRSFDPNEEYRLSARDALKNVASSLGVIVNLLGTEHTDYFFNNLRGAFIAGAALGLSKELLLLQERNYPVPLDYRDLVSTYKHPEDIDRFINEFAPLIIEKMQEENEASEVESLSLLEGLELGAPAAENESTKLSAYYMKTDQFRRVLDSEVRLVVGRKGSGKTALFFQLRDHLRSNKKNVVIDLKPDGPQLQRFKTKVLQNVQESIQEDLATAFWEYLLLLEISFKLLEKDRKIYLHDHKLQQSYNKLAEICGQDYSMDENDFSERMLILIQRINNDFHQRFPGEDNIFLEHKEVIELIYQHDVANLRSILMEYLSHKEIIYILFDNLDKAWPTHGIEAGDILVLRSLMEATRKIQRTFAKQQVDFRSTVFIRNDVYHFLIDQTPDRGKEQKVSIDWTDKEMFREFLRKRFVYSIGEDLPFEKFWFKICESHINGEDTADYLFNLSMMRPRNLISLLGHCKGQAVNLGHKVISAEDIQKAAKAYSTDLGNDIALEIRDVFPEGQDILYAFFDTVPFLTIEEVKELLQKANFDSILHNKIITTLLWFGFFGIDRSKADEENINYIFDVFYDMRKLLAMADNLSNDKQKLVIHKAFWPFLELEGLSS